MKKFLICIIGLICCIGTPNAAVRDGTATPRQNTKQTQARTATTPKRTTTARTSRALSARSASKNTLNRNATTITPKNNPTTIARTKSTRVTSSAPRLISRATTNTTNITSETKTGAEYERCKSTYFACMDQFCSLKNDSYRRCSCNDRIFDLEDARKIIEDAGEQLNAFTENLDIVGMTSAQATALRTASEGEDALTADKSASKALLQAIMNSIRGEDTNVSGKYSDLNSINLSFDTSGSFDTIGAGQAIATYNGLALYNAVYPQCRTAVKSDCNDASLQRAINAYLMAIEQDCNTVQSAIEKTQKQVKAGIREGGAMLDLARIENRKKHNSSDIPTCINAVEKAILSEEVCGTNYHKCLDNGEFINIDTGEPITGIKDFFKLEETLAFTDGVEAVHQKLAQNPQNRVFVENFTNRTKKFAQPALDTCVENADFVWSEYLDKAMLAIYYAQKDKVSEIKQNCFNYISECYVNNNTALDGGMSQLSDDKKTGLELNRIALNSQMCSDYIESCNNMFDNNIISEYIAQRDTNDTLAACRAVVKQCFDKFGGTNYENLFNPNSGLFETGRAIDWFTLYHYKYQNGKQTRQAGYVSQCAQELTKIDACNTPEIIEQAFGGFDSYITNRFLDTGLYTGTAPQLTNNCDPDASNTKYYGCINNLQNIKYGLLSSTNKLLNRNKRPTGVASEIYNQIISHLNTQCTGKQGRFLEIQTQDLIDFQPYKIDMCAYSRTGSGTTSSHGISWLENVCPMKYQEMVDTASWGICSCWHNGGRRSRWGTTESCMPILPVSFPLLRQTYKGTDSTTLLNLINESDAQKTSFSADNDTKTRLLWDSANNQNLNNYSFLWFTYNNDTGTYSINNQINKEVYLNDIPCSKVITLQPVLKTKGITCSTNSENITTCSLTTEDIEIAYNSENINGFAKYPNDIHEPGARITTRYDSSGNAQFWCTQDQISKYDQVCSYTGINSNKECNPVPSRYDDQYNNAQSLNPLTETSTLNSITIPVKNIVPHGNKSK